MIELLMAVAIVLTCVGMLGQQVSIGYTELRRSSDLAFANERATSILSELRAAIGRGEIDNAADLARHADDDHNPVLTSQRKDDGGLLAPDHPSSANMSFGGRWVWSRRIEVEPHPDQPNLRYVRVTVYKRDWGGGFRKAAAIGSLMALEASVFRPRKVYDVYAIAITGAPSLWQGHDALRATLGRAEFDLEDSCRSIDVRLHWIEQLGYGRDQLYAPYVNDSTSSGQPVPWAFWYPGLLSGGSHALYPAERFRARIRTDDGMLNSFDPVDNPWPVAVTDQFNHCMRLPEARALHEERLAAGLESEDEPPLQILLADLHENPDRYRNAIFVNLHGPALPFPPMRNFADAARWPEQHPGVRVVTHATRLWLPRTGAGGRSAEFRVYAYKTDPASGPSVLAEPVTVRIPGPDLSAAINADSDPSLLIHRLPGGVNATDGTVDDPAPYRAFDSADGMPPLAGDADAPFEMQYEAGYEWTPIPHTWIKLYNTPLRAPEVGLQGLAASQRLYGMEYIPSAVTGGDFTTHLATERTSAVPRNTARWRIRLPATSLLSFGGDDRRITVITSIGDDPEAGTVWPVSRQPANRSVTYCWFAESREAVPLVERYQINGDPRHCPYADLTVVGDGFPDGYNAFFDDLVDGGVDATDQWPVFDRALLRDGYGEGVRWDVPRALQVWHAALARAGATFVELGADGSHYVVRGGELCASPPAPDRRSSPLLVHGSLFGSTDPVFVDTMTPSTSSPDSITGQGVITSSGAEPYSTLAWLGELCPDSSFASYRAFGNLEAGAFLQAARSVAPPTDLPPGTSFSGPAGSVAGAGGTGAWLPGFTEPSDESDSWFVVTPSGTPDQAFFSVLAGHPAGDDGVQLAFQALLHGVLSCYRAAEQSDGRSVVQQPLVEIVEPRPGELSVSGDGLQVRWATSSRRLDGDRLRYVESPLATAESQFVYTVMMSWDDGRTWYDASTGETAVPGARPEPETALRDIVDGDESFLIDRRLLRTGSLLVRVDAYHETRRPHSSFHQVQVDIE